MLSTHPPEECGQSYRDAVFLGMRVIAPYTIATGTWGLVTGMAMVKSGLPESIALIMTLLVYAGSAQLTTLPLIVTGAPLWLIFAAGLVVNLRFVIFAAALHPYLRALSWPRRLALGYFTTDMAFVLFIQRFGHAPAKGGANHVGFYTGCLIPGWVAWQCASITGIYVGRQIPDAWSPGFAAVLALLALTIPLINSRPVLLAALAAAVTAWVAQPLPLRLGLVAAVVVGIVVGMWAEKALGLIAPAPAPADKPK